MEKKDKRKDKVQREKEAILAEYEPVLKKHNLQLRPEGQGGDAWLCAYVFVKRSEARREEWRKRAKRLQELKEAKYLLERAAGVSLKAASGASVSLGLEASEWLIDMIEQELEEAQGPFFFYEGVAYYGMDIKEQYVRDYLEEWAEREYSMLRGKGGKFEYASLLGFYVHSFIFEIDYDRYARNEAKEVVEDGMQFIGPKVPEGVSEMNSNELYATIGDLLERAGVLASVKGEEWVNTIWRRMGKTQRARTLKDWYKAYCSAKDKEMERRIAEQEAKS